MIQIMFDQRVLFNLWYFYKGIDYKYRMESLVVGNHSRLVYNSHLV